MPTNDLIKMFGRAGITAESAEVLGDSVVEFATTIGGFGKLKSIPAPTLELVDIRGNRVIGRIALEVLETLSPAPASGERRTSAKDGAIVSVTAYRVTPNSDDVNAVTYAEFSSDSKRGFIRVNGAEFAVVTEPASEHYQVGEMSDPDRPVFVFWYADENGEPHKLTSYGMTNLIRSVMSLDEAIIPAE